MIKKTVKITHIRRGRRQTKEVEIKFLGLRLYKATTTLVRRINQVVEPVKTQPEPEKMWLNFMEACEKGLEEPNKIHLYKQAWEEDNRGLSLAEYLGMTDFEYFSYVDGVKSIDELLQKRFKS